MTRLQGSRLPACRDPAAVDSFVPLSVQSVPQCVHPRLWNLKKQYPNSALEQRDKCGEDDAGRGRAGRSCEMKNASIASAGMAVVGRRPVRCRELG